MESFDSPENYMRGTSRFDAKKEYSPGGSECDDIMSVSSSTCGSANNAPKLSKNGIMYRTSNKKTMKNFGNIKSFRRRAKSRVIEPLVTISDEDSLVDCSQSSSPHYLKATSSSEGKKNSESPMHSHRNVRILIKKTSFKPKRPSSSHSKVSEDVSVDRATYSSIIKDSKFPEAVEVRVEPEKSSAVKVCRYHHCSLHGHCQGSHEPVKRFVYKSRRLLKKQKSIVPKAESRIGAKQSSGKKKNLLKMEMVPIVEPLDQVSVVGSNNVAYENEDELHGDGYKDIRVSELFEVAFGEMSFPERSYQENLEILRKYSSWERNVYCSRCSCHDTEEVTSTPGRADRVEIPQNRSSDASDTSSPEPKERLRAYIVDSHANELPHKDSPESLVVFDEATVKNSAFSSASSVINSEGEAGFTTESTQTGDSNVNKVVQVEDSETNSPASKLQFSKPRHISMWNLIHQHMSSNLAAENTNKPLDGENPMDDSADSNLAKESTASSREVPDLDDSETQEIEIRKIFAIKLVREAIEKILLPEVQDQTSDDQSITSESSPRSHVIENNQTEDCAQDDASSDPKDESVIPKNPSGETEKSVVGKSEQDESVIPNNASGETEKPVVRKSEKKAPKHWSNLKKWILLQRFIRELEKVRKFNPRKPRHLPLDPDPETEKVNLRSQPLDGRKSAEEWMLDYALRQAVSQLAPTQKKKVSLLVKAFETVAPPQEDPQAQIRIPRLFDFGSRDNKMDDDLVNGKAVLSSDDSVSENQETGIKMTKETSTTRSLILDGNGKLEANETEREAMPTLQGFEGDAISDSRDEKANHSDESNTMDRKNNIKMWHMIYQHVVSGIAEKVGSSLLDGSEDDEVDDNISSTVSNNEYSNDSPEPTNDTGNESSNLTSGLTKSDALKLVKEAVDEILLPEIQDDSSDCQSITSESTPDQDIFESDGGRDIVGTGEDSRAESRVGIKSELPKLKNWSKLKRLILLKRSIKALEKARKVKPQPHELFAQVPNTEPEKIDLRRQMMDERKKAEQWMLDYTVQHIVTKLTPARKRRVSMLVEAFEAVVPLPET